ncbi:MAG: transposase [Bacteroidetes bacterium HGW-Bacteroidetes-1]|jgi:putative transposase|nr:MAG: transposase [Bacteroidetes bacterium HGW-Bacteroidetes-1]
MNKTFKYRIYPTKSQVKKLNDNIRACRFVWNTFLNERKVLYETEKKQISCFDQTAKLTELKKEFPFLKNAYSQSLQQIVIKLDLSFKSFFRRIQNGETPGYPRFKGCYRLSSIYFTQFGKGCKIANGKLAVSKIGDIKLVYHRELIGTPKTATIKRTPTGKWFVSICCETDNTILQTNDLSVGIDLGISKFATFSDGTVIENPRFFKEEEIKIKKAQSKTDKLVKGSKERFKARKVVNRIYERLSWKRDNFSHQESRKVINKYQNIILEKLEIYKLIHNGYPNLNKCITDVAWNKFTSLVQYKAVEAGRTVILVNPKNTTKTCSQCGKIVDKSLSERVHNCSCGLVLDRDLNAAINILRLGTQSLQRLCLSAE